MVFSSVFFLFGFLPLVIALYFLAPARLRNAVLLGASLFFYAWGEPVYVAALLVSIGLNYGCGLWVERGGRLAVGCAVAGNLLLLGWFKYAGFVAENLNRLLSGSPEGPLDLAPVHLPIGISFFTFQAMSYVIDVYRGQGAAQRSPLRLALYISMFPQLIAGPIVRFRDVAEQLVQRHTSLDDFAAGTRRFGIGLAKKVLIANPLGWAADSIFAIPEAQLTTSLAWLGALSYTLQIYFDFSGYSDMAIGLGRVFGFHFLENFRWPYVSRSLTEFWRRWHISLSSWFRDYLYIPLGGNRRGTARTALHLLIVFALCGLWHGASWTFVIWGLYHGAFLGAERLARGRALPALPAPLRIAWTLLVVVVGWVIFRAETLTQAGAFLAAMAGSAAGDGLHFYPAMYVDSVFVFTFACGLVAATPIASAIRQRIEAHGGAAPAWADAAVALAALALLGASAVQLSVQTYNPFIYFRF